MTVLYFAGEEGQLLYNTDPLDVTDKRNWFLNDPVVSHVFGAADKIPGSGDTAVFIPGNFLLIGVSTHGVLTAATLFSPVSGSGDLDAPYVVNAILAGGSIEADTIDELRVGGGAVTADIVGALSMTGGSLTADTINTVTSSALSGVWQLYAHDAAGHLAPAVPFGFYNFTIFRNCGRPGG